MIGLIINNIQNALVPMPMLKSAYPIKLQIKKISLEALRCTPAGAGHLSELSAELDRPGRLSAERPGIKSNPMRTIQTCPNLLFICTELYIRFQGHKKIKFLQVENSCPHKRMAIL